MVSDIWVNLFMNLIDAALVERRYRSAVRKLEQDQENVIKRYFIDISCPSDADYPEGYNGLELVAVQSRFRKLVSENPIDYVKRIIRRGTFRIENGLFTVSRGNLQLDFELLYEDVKNHEELRTYFDTKENSRFDKVEGLISFEDHNVSLLYSKWQTKPGFQINDTKLEKRLIKFFQVH